MNLHTCLQCCSAWISVRLSHEYSFCDPLLCGAPSRQCADVCDSPGERFKGANEDPFIFWGISKRLCVLNAFLLLKHNYVLIAQLEIGVTDVTALFRPLNPLQGQYLWTIWRTHI